MKKVKNILETVAFSIMVLLVVFSQIDKAMWLWDQAPNETVQKSDYTKNDHGLNTQPDNNVAGFLNSRFVVINY